MNPMRSDLFKLVGSLNVRYRKNISGVNITGENYHSKGRGMEFKDVRKYSLGDDVRFIDWNVTSRMGEIHIKEFYQEKDIPVHVILDVSSSMTTFIPKIEIAIQVAILLSYIHILTGNKVEISAYSDTWNHISYPIKSMPGLWKTIGKLEEILSQSMGGLSKAGDEKDEMYLFRNKSKNVPPNPSNIFNNESTNLSKFTIEDSTKIRNPLNKDSSNLRNPLNKDSSNLRNPLKKDSSNLRNPFKNDLSNTTGPIKNDSSNTTDPIKNDSSNSSYLFNTSFYPLNIFNKSSTNTRKTNHRIVISRMQNYITRRSLVYWISDFAGFPSINRAEGSIFKKHEVHGICMIDNTLEEIPDPLRNCLFLESSEETNLASDVMDSKKNDLELAKMALGNYLTELNPMSDIPKQILALYHGGI